MMSIYNYFKKEEFEENNVKLEVIEDKENSYVVRFDKEKAIATLKLKMPDSTRHYYTHYKNIIILDMIGMMRDIIMFLK